MLGQYVLLTCGEQYIHWPDLDDFENTTDSEAWLSGAAEWFLAMRRIADEAPQYPPSRRPTWDAYLALSSTLESSDPRDHVFGLLGILKMPPLLVDYRHSPQQVFWAVMRVLNRVPSEAAMHGWYELGIVMGVGHLDLLRGGVDHHPFDCHDCLLSWQPWM